MLTVGTLFLIIGLIGIFIPLLPTTPFLLLTAYCYTKGSDKMYTWLISNRLFGSYLNDYYVGRGLSVKSKIFTISFLWATIIFSMTFILDIIIIQIILFFVAIAVTGHIILIKTKKETLHHDVRYIQKS